MKGSRGLQKVKGPFKVFPSFSSEGDADLPQNNFHSPLPGKWKRGFVQKPRLLPILQKKKKTFFINHQGYFKWTENNKNNQLSSVIDKGCIFLDF